MSLTYITKCDACSIRLNGWNDDIEGWAAVTLNNGISNDRLDFCPDCWKKMAYAVELQFKLGGIPV